ncbi:hypothetical protein ES703_82603 [subsurface metagenome]
MDYGSDIGIKLRCTGKVVAGRYGRLAVIRHPHVFYPIDIYTKLSSISSHHDDVMPLTINNWDVTAGIELGAIIINDRMNIIVTVKHQLVPYSRECCAGMVPALAKDGHIARRGRGYFYPGRYGPIACSEVKNALIAAVHMIVCTIEVQRTAELSFRPSWASIEGPVAPVAT